MYCFGGGHANEREADDAANWRDCVHLTAPAGTNAEIPRRILFDFVIRIVLSDLRHGPELTSPWLRAEFTHQRFTRTVILNDNLRGDRHVLSNSKVERRAATKRLAAYSRRARSNAGQASGPLSCNKSSRNSSAWASHAPVGRQPRAQHNPRDLLDS